MFPDADSNSFTVPYSDQFLLYSNLLDDADTGNYNQSPYSPFSFFDQNISTHPLFFSPQEQELELQNNPLARHHEEPPMLTAFEEFTMADTSSNNSNSMGGYCATENLRHNGLASDLENGNSSSPVERMKIDKVSKNASLSKKDRHSKINTAQGPRDRRVRLSLDIAKRFFGLQDMLGFDRPSKTVDWLLSKSQSDINMVVNSKTNDGNNAETKSDSFGAWESCGEVYEVVNKEDVSLSGEMDANNGIKKFSSKKKKSSGKVAIPSRNGLNSVLAKESREKARARARERTKEKMMICTLQKNSKHEENVNHFSNMDQHMRNQVIGANGYSYADQGHTMTNQDQSLVNSSYWNPSSCTFNSQQPQTNKSSHQLAFEDIQFYAKPWETYN